jgi:hypothetical protein
MSTCLSFNILLNSHFEIFSLFDTSNKLPRMHVV